MRERLPLATIQDAVLEFLRHRQDAVLFGAQAVNAYTDEPRMTREIDVMSVRPEELAEEIRAHLAARFHIAARVRVVKAGQGYRIYQVRQPAPRHLVNVRRVESLPPSERIDGVSVMAPAELIARKVISMVRRARTPKGLTDAADVRRMLLAFPALKIGVGEVRQRLEVGGATAAALAAWAEVVAAEILPEGDDAEFE